MIKLSELKKLEPTERLPAWEWQELRIKALERDDYKCVKDNKPTVDVDHIMPLCLGGENRLSNLQSLCKECHKIKTKEDISKNTKLKHVKKIEKQRLKLY